ncbi:MAG: helix-turn-helix domain-containing protein, partial [Streptococcus sp.]|nr:helix-turn-helix domain-containing protein [Streptococcus sp.]
MNSEYHRIKNTNIIISLVFEKDTLIEVQVKLEYQHYYVLKKPFFQCKGRQKVTVVETSIVEKKHQISNLVRQKVKQLLQKVKQLLTEKGSLTDIAKKLHVSRSTVYHKLDQ